MALVHRCPTCGSLLTDASPAVTGMILRRPHRRYPWFGPDVTSEKFYACQDCARLSADDEAWDQTLLRPLLRFQFEGELHHCQWCEVPVILWDDPRRKFVCCSPVCKGYLEEQALKSESRWSTVIRCGECGVQFKGRRGSKFCCVRCKRKFHYRRNTAG